MAMTKAKAKTNSERSVKVEKQLKAVLRREVRGMKKAKGRGEEIGERSVELQNFLLRMRVEGERGK